MSESNLPPEQWRPYFDRADIEFGYRPLAARAGLTHTRVHRLIRGGGTTNEAIQQVADALGVKASKVRELRGEPPVEIEPFTLPDDAGRLNETERNVVRAMVRALLDARDNAHAADLPATDPPATTEDAQGTAREDQKTAYAGLSASELEAAIEQHPAVAYAEMVQDPLELLAITFVGAIDQAEQATDAFVRESLAAADLAVSAIGTTPEMVSELIISERETVNTAIQWVNGLKRITPHRAAYFDVRAQTWTALFERFVESARKPRRERVALTPGDVDAVSGRINQASEQMLATLSTAHQMYDNLRANRSGRTMVSGVSVRDNDARIYAEYEQGLAQTEASLAGAAAAIQQPAAAQVHHLADHRSQAEPLRQSERWAARDLGDEPVGRKIRRRQDEAGELPDPEGPEGGA